jgi:hypothetical protein
MLSPKRDVVAGKHIQELSPEQPAEGFNEQEEILLPRTDPTPAVG